MIKKILITGAILAAAFSIPAIADDSAGFGSFSEGYRVGQITKFSVKGLMTKSGEGQMLVGRESSPYIKTYSCGDSTCQKRINPWHFSASMNKAKQIQAKAGEYAIIKYNQAQVRNALKYDTDYMVESVMDIKRNVQPPNCTASNLPEASKSDGVRVGRLTKVSNKGHLNKTYEAQMQVGNSGSQFKNFTLYDKAMFDCAVSVLMTAKKVKIYYTEMWFRVPFSADTNYAITKIEVPQDI